MYVIVFSYKSEGEKGGIMGPCCPFLTSEAGNPPYLLWAFIVFCVIALVKIMKALSKIVKLLEKK